MRTYDDYLCEKLKDPEFAGEFLIVADEVPVVFHSALRKVAEVQGRAEVAGKAEVPRESRKNHELLAQTVGVCRWVWNQALVTPINRQNVTQTFGGLMVVNYSL